MAGHEYDHALPTTAEELLAAYPSVYAIHDERGRVVIGPMDGPHAPRRPIYGMLAMAFPRMRTRREATLEISSSTKASRPDIALAIPVLGSIADVQVTRSGEVSKDELLDVVRQGVGLLSTYRRLSESEQHRLLSIDLPGAKVWDMGLVDEPEINEETIEGLPYEVIMRGALSVARRVLLEAK